MVSYVLQSNEYYTYGLQTANLWTRENNTGNNFLYNEGSELNTNTYWYDLPYRNYDPALGRFAQIDPLATSDHTLTPYHYAGNDPISFNDPSGLARRQQNNGGFGDESERRQDGTSGGWGMDAGGSASAWRDGAGSSGNSFWDVVRRLFGFSDGGYWVNNGVGSFTRYTSQTEAFYAASDYADQFGLWGKNGYAASFELAAMAFSLESKQPLPLRATEVVGNRITGYRGEPYSNTAWLTERLNRAWGIDPGAEQKINGPSFWKMTADGMLNMASLANETHLFQMTRGGTQIALSSKLAYTTSRSFGTKIGYAGVILTPIDAAIKGQWQNHHTADMAISTAFIIAGAIPGINLGVAVIGILYYAVDLGVQVKTGKSITENLLD